MAIPARPLQIGPFIDGVQYAGQAELLPGTALYAMKNVELDPSGRAATRLGWSSELGSFGGLVSMINIGYHRFTVSEAKIWAISDTFFKSYNLSDQTWTNQTQSFTITPANENYFSVADAAGVLIGTNGISGDVIFKWENVANFDFKPLAALDVDSRFTTARHVAYWDGRAWAGHLDNGVDRVWRSDLLDIETWGATAFHTIDGQISALVPFRTALTVHAEDGLWALFPTGDATTPYTLQKRADIGSISERAAVIDPFGNMYLMQPDGIYRWNTASMTETQVSGMPAKISQPLDGPRYWDQVNSDYLAHAAAVVYPDKNAVWFMLPFGPSQITLNHIMIWDYVRNRWYGPYTNYAGASIALIDRVPHIGAYDLGSIYTGEFGTNDDGSAIDAWFETAAPPLSDGGDRHRLLYARTYFDQVGDFTMSFTQTLPDDTVASSTFTMEGNFDTIENDFEIEASAIFAGDTAEYIDTTLKGYAPSTKLKYANSTLDEWFAIRYILVHGKPVGRHRVTR